MTTESFIEWGHFAGNADNLVITVLILKHDSDPWFAILKAMVMLKVRL